MGEIAITSPSLNGENGHEDGPENGRGVDGKFVKGWRGGPGNPMSKRMNRLKVAMQRAVKPKDIHAITAKLVEMAKAGDVLAAKEIYNRCFGKPLQAMTVAPSPGEPGEVVFSFRQFFQELGELRRQQQDRPQDDEPPLLPPPPAV